MGLGRLTSLFFRVRLSASLSEKKGFTKRIEVYVVIEHTILSSQYKDLGELFPFRLGSRKPCLVALLVFGLVAAHNLMKKEGLFFFSSYY